jgi:hypothetical protein
MNNIQLGKIGVITQEVINALKLSIVPDTPIYIGQSNIIHMLKKHPSAYIKYGSYIHDIVSHPDYVGINPNDNSIEYVKEFKVDNNYVKVAVRVSSGGKFYARSLYILNPSRVKNFITKGTLKQLTSLSK